MTDFSLGDLLLANGGAPPQDDDSQTPGGVLQSYEVAGGPGSGRTPGTKDSQPRATGANSPMYQYQSIFDKKPLQMAPPGFELDEQGNYSRIKTGALAMPLLALISGDGRGRNG